ncbi:hypothetical protein GGH95_006181, partial [Coemansia sp. RSA 1836]
MFGDVYVASSTGGQQLPQKRQRNHRRQSSSPERLLRHIKPNGECDNDDDNNNGSGGDDDFHGNGGVELADLARMSPTSRRRHQSRMSSARHRERQHKRIISTTDEVERLEGHIMAIQKSIDTYRSHPPVPLPPPPPPPHLYSRVAGT